MRRLSFIRPLIFASIVSCFSVAVTHAALLAEVGIDIEPSLQTHPEGNALLYAFGAGAPGVIGDGSARLLPAT
jgi:hypothetical protein